METGLGERTGIDRFLGKYAHRLARLCVLTAQCPEDHPMLSTERNLMDMARSKLQEALLRKLSVDGFRRMRPDLEYLIRQSAKEDASLWSVPAGSRAPILRAIDAEPLDSLFTLDC